MSKVFQLQEENNPSCLTESKYSHCKVVYVLVHRHSSCPTSVCSTDLSNGFKVHSNLFPCFFLSLKCRSLTCSDWRRSGKPCKHQSSSNDMRWWLIFVLKKSGIVMRTGKVVLLQFRAKSIFIFFSVMGWLHKIVNTNKNNILKWM